MHHSRLCSFIIDCRTDDLAEAARFWSQALGRAVAPGANPANTNYIGLAMHDDEPIVEVQQVGHASRIHLDIESDDVAAEVRRVVALGATVLEEREDYTILQDPGGLVFCVVPIQTGEDFERHALTWE